MDTGRVNRRSIASMMGLLMLACLLVLKSPPVCEIVASPHMADMAACPEMPHKPPVQKSASLACAAPCLLANTAIVAPLATRLVQNTVYDASSAETLRSVNEGPAPPPPRTRDRPVFYNI
ncbi:MAG: hypothetical protein CVT77_00675 [Alphaproteobacteria bacterium HGW-Alphaproteobacteria-16]|jgi:hypothetical protein|nr:MAG: hypothetical protein CVT77_00675 [Alphaproteobacteria bacterium HGW-Alphaproteobacteria-16]